MCLRDDGSSGPWPGTNSVWSAHAPPRFSHSPSSCLCLVIDLLPCCCLVALLSALPPAQVYVHNQWGTVCDDLFSSVDAMVACNELGFEFGWDLDPSDVEMENVCVGAFARVESTRCLPTPASGGVLPSRWRAACPRTHACFGASLPDKLAGSMFVFCLCVKSMNEMQEFVRTHHFYGGGVCGGRAIPAAV